MFAIEFNDGCPVHVSILRSLFEFALFWVECFIFLSEHFCGFHFRCMLARLVIACLQQFGMSYKRK